MIIIHNYSLYNKKIIEYYKKGNKYAELTKIFDNYPISMVSIDWWTFRGWSEEYAIEKIKELLTERANLYSKKRSEHPELYIGSNSTTLEYYLKKGYSNDEARELLRQRQTTTSLESYIRRYGEEEGTIRFNERNRKWQETLTNRDDYMDIVNKRVENGSYCSNISQELFDSVRELLINNGYNMKMYYKRLNHKWGFGVKGIGGFLYDFVIPELNYAIEYNGERFHPNIEIYDTIEKQATWTNPWGVTFEEQYLKDMAKNQAIIDRGFRLDIVWNNDYLANKEKVAKKIYETIVKIYEETLTNQKT